MNFKIIFILNIIIYFIIIFVPFFLTEEGLLEKLDFNLFSLSEFYIFGNGESGISILVWIVYGIRISFFIAFSYNIVSLSVGIICGFLSGFYRGVIGLIVMRIIKILEVFPGLLFAIFVSSIFQSNVINTIIALSIIGWIGYTKIIRKGVIQRKKYILMNIKEQFFAYLIPHFTYPVLIQLIFKMSIGITFEVALSYLGLGVSMETPSLGVLLQQGVNHFFVAPYLSVFPGVCVVISAFSFSFLSEELKNRY